MSDLIHSETVRPEMAVQFHRAALDAPRHAQGRAASVPSPATGWAGAAPSRGLSSSRPGSSSTTGWIAEDGFVAEPGVVGTTRYPARYSRQLKRQGIYCYVNQQRGASATLRRSQVLQGRRPDREPGEVIGGDRLIPVKAEDTNAAIRRISTEEIARALCARTPD